MKFVHSPLLSQLVPAWRGRFVLLLLLTGFAGLVARSVYLQAVNHDFLQQKGELRYSRVIDLSATRGRIVDRNGGLQMRNMERDLGDSGELRRNSNIGRGQVVISARSTAKPKPAPHIHSEA